MTHSQFTCANARHFGIFMVPLVAACACGCSTVLSHLDDNPHAAYQGVKLDEMALKEMVSSNDHVAAKILVVPLVAIDTIPSACLDTLIYPLDAYARKDRAARGLSTTLDEPTNETSDAQTTTNAPANLPNDSTRGK